MRGVSKERKGAQNLTKAGKQGNHSASCGSHGKDGDGLLWVMEKSGGGSHLEHNLVLRG